MSPRPFDLPPDWARAAFSPDPNPSFADLVRRLDPGMLPASDPGTPLTFPHGTTILALRFADGIVMAGDLRPTAGVSRADRRMGKQFPPAPYTSRCAPRA